MNLFSPDRPQLNGQILYLNSYVVITGLRVVPHPDGSFELSTFLPIEGEAMWVTKRFSARVPEVDSWLNRFVLDPEETLETLFDGDRMRPALRNTTNRRPMEELVEELDDLDLV